MSAPTVRDYAETWTRRMLSLYRPNTQRNYRSMLKCYILPRLGDHPLPELTRLGVRGMLIALLEDERLSPKTVQLVLATLSNVITTAIDDGLLETNPCQTAGRRLLRVHEDAAAETMSAAQLARFLAAAERTHPRLAVFFAVLSRTGCRIGEGLSLRVQDCNLDGRWLAVARTYLRAGRFGPSKSRPRRVDLSRDAVRLLRDVIARATPSDYLLFRGRGRSPWSTEKVQKEFRRAIVAAGLPPWTTHVLRHCFASRLISAGVSPAYVQRQLGHADITTTMRIYGSGLPYRDLDAIDRLDQLEAQA